MHDPLDAIDAIHSAFRLHLQQIDEEAYAVAANGGSLDPTIERLRLTSEFLLLHADGEEKFVFTAIDKIAPHLVELYTKDHRELDTMTEGLAKIESARTPLDAARATAVLRNHLRIHLDKEDTYLYPMLRAHTTPAEQAPIVGGMAGGVPPERMPAFIDWLFPIIDTINSVKMADVWKQLMPEPVFANLAPLVEKATGDDWAEIARQIGLA